jgi:fructose-bisphosphate aldolase class II
VEGEIGDIGTGSEVREHAQSLSSSLTTPAEAKQFVEATGIDILAPAVGNSHGMLKNMVQGGTKEALGYCENRSDQNGRTDSAHPARWIGNRR